MSSTSTPQHANVVPSEVGWQFVPQYYTYMNKQPSRLHCFYTKNSTFVHGTEGEDVKPCFGQQEIHNKILSIGFNDCKVFIHSVDAQSSSNGGIIIQVIGEMSNNGESWRKFAQTFFLAEQPNGYFVLNDIFRYLKEEAVESEDAEPATEAPVESTQVARDWDAVDEPQQTNETLLANVVEPEQVPKSPVDTTNTTKLNGFHPESKHESEAEPTVTVQLEVVEEVQATTPESPTQADEPAQGQPSELSAEVPAPAPAPTPAATLVPTATQPMSLPQQPPAPPAPKTWANLAAANSNKWGNAVAQEAKGVSAAAAPSVSPIPSGANTPSRDGHHTPNRAPRDASHHPAYIAAMSVTTAQCFVKGVTEVVSHPALTSYLTQRFGPVKELEIVRNKACAFLEFEKLESAKKAIVASLPLPQGGEGGIRIDTGEQGQVRINVETRKERGERPVPRSRGGAPNGEARGGFRGRGGGGPGERGGRGRGGGPSGK